ncbi:FecR family protein [Pedobacter steynii]|nr:FecR family protein [Pedobacter steynii]
MTIKIHTPLWAERLMLFLIFVVLVIPSGCKDDGAYQVYQSRPGHRLSLKLPDGSSVLLNSNSILKVPHGYHKDSRKVILLGAAFFTVAPGSVFPFVVESTDIKASTMGASFFARAYPHESGRQIEVTAGNLKVEKSYHSESDNKAEFLLPGEMVMLNRTVDLMEKEKYAITERQSWLMGQLKFNNVGFPKVLEILEDWYGVPFEIIGEKKLNHNFSADFTNQPLERVLKVLCLSAHCDFKIEDGKAILEAN